MPSDKLNAAIQFIQSGHKQTAVPVLRELIQENPADELPWLWLHLCMDDPEHKKFCLQRALAINPANIEARHALDVLLMEPVEESALPVEIETEKRPWEETVAEDDLVWQRAVPDTFESSDNWPRKFNWEQAESVQPDDLASQRDEPLIREPEKVTGQASVKALKPQPKAASHPAQRRKPRSRRRSLFPILAGLVLMVMLMTVCLVFVFQFVSAP